MVTELGIQDLEVRRSKSPTFLKIIVREQLIWSRTLFTKRGQRKFELSITRFMSK